MLYETLSQPTILLFVIIVGFLSGIIFDFANVLFLLFDKNKIMRIILDVVCTLIVAGVLFLLILKISYGELRLWQILFFSTALCIERETIGKLVAKFILICYNFFVKFLKICFKKRSDLIKQGENE